MDCGLDTICQRIDLSLIILKIQLPVEWETLTVFVVRLTKQASVAQGILKVGPGAEP